MPSQWAGSAAHTVTRSASWPTVTTGSAGSADGSTVATRSSNGRIIGRAGPISISRWSGAASVWPYTSATPAGIVSRYVRFGSHAPWTQMTFSYCSTVRALTAGSMPSASGSNVSGSSSLLNTISTPSPGRQGCPHRTRVTRSGAYVRIEKRCSAADTAGPSADGMPAANVTAISCAVVNGSTGVNATKRPSTASATAVWAASSAVISSAVANRMARASPSAVTLTRASTASASTSWSKVATSTGCSGRSLRPLPVSPWTSAGGVEKATSTASASSAPLADRVPAGTVIV